MTRFQEIAVMLVLCTIVDSGIGGLEAIVGLDRRIALRLVGAHRRGGDGEGEDQGQKSGSTKTRHALLQGICWAGTTDIF